MAILVKAPGDVPVHTKRLVETTHAPVAVARKPKTAAEPNRNTFT